MTRLLATLIAGGLCLATLEAQTDLPNPHPRQVLEERVVAEWHFDGGEVEGWRFNDQAEATPTAESEAFGSWKLESTGNDPILESPKFEPVLPGAVVVLRMRKTAEGAGRIFWMGDAQPIPSEDHAISFRTHGDGKWHEYRVRSGETFPIDRFRLDPATTEGDVEIDWIRIEHRKVHPLEFVSVDAGEAAIEVGIRNQGSQPRSVSLNELGAREIAPGATELFSLEKPTSETSLQPFRLTAKSEGLPDLGRRTLLLNRQAAITDPINVTSDGIALRIAPDGSVAKVVSGDTEVAWLAPLAMRDGKAVALTKVAVEGNRVRFRGPGIERLEIGIEDGVMVFEGRASFDGIPFEGPVLRSFGSLEQGLLAGVEHLGKGEQSSSSLDIHGPERIRHTPDPMLLTMPLMGVVTGRGSLAMRWDDTSLQPVFATPNFFEGGPDHRMALRGREIRARIRVGNAFEAGERIEDAVLWAVRENGGLPPIPEAPRSHHDQLAFCHEGLMESVIRAEEGGWYHAPVPGPRSSPEKPKYFADHLSTLFRLTGEIPELPELVPGGAHLENSAIYFLTGRAEQWLTWRGNRVKNMIRSQRHDGSWRYGGEYRAGHFEDTSSGQCARNAAHLLRHARMTGDAEAKAAGLKALSFMKRFRTPRGAQVWECPLHAPDIMASAYALQAYIFGYELTGDEQYRDLAERWALSGVPFVYQWSNRPIMRYATTATLCATHYKAPVWIGRPVQWCGIVYADALLDLAPHDDTLDWRKLAEGILISGEQQQYLEGPSRGLLADSLILKTQTLLPFDINPCALVSLRLRLAGGAAGLHFAEREGRQVIAPFPVRIEDGEAVVSGNAGLSYQVIIDGERIIEVKSKGKDRIDW